MARNHHDTSWTGTDLPAPTKYQPVPQVVQLSIHAYTCPVNCTGAKDVRIISFTEARNGLKAVLDRVVNDADTTVITRRDSEDAVLMSLDYYNSLMETVHLLRSPANAEHLGKSIAQYKAGKAVERELVGEDE